VDACIILNPAAGRGRAGRLRPALHDAFARGGGVVDLRETTHPGHERDLARAAAHEGWPVVVAAGGDGTVHGVVNGLLEASAESALGVVPMGTGNDFAKLTGIPRGAPRPTADHLGRAVVRRFDVGHAAGEYFANGLGFGFGPAVIRHMSALPRLRGFALYLIAAYRTFADFRPVVVSLDAAEYHETGPVMLAEIAVGTTAGGGFRLTPDADPTDGQFDVCVIREVGLLEFLRYLPKVVRGAHIGLPPVTVFRTARITWHGQPPLELHMDGELRTIEADHLDVRVAPARLKVLCAP
jgi:YegS/Rv2252/BmrU family lipid kinase